MGLEASLRSLCLGLQNLFGRVGQDPATPLDPSCSPLMEFRHIECRLGQIGFKFHLFEPAFNMAKFHWGDNHSIRA